MSTKIKDFTTGNIFSQLVIFSFPLFLSNLLQILYNMVDMIIVGHVLGKEGISAVSVGGDISHFMTFIAMGFSNAAQVIIAKYVGRNERDKLFKFVGTTAGFLFVCALCISILSFIFKNQLLFIMNTPIESYNEALNYSVVSMLGLVFIYGYNVVSAILRGMGDSKHPFIFISIAAILNVLLDLLFVINLELGAKGAAIATVLSQGLSFVLCLIYLNKNAKLYCLIGPISVFYKWDKYMLKELIGLGVPMAIKTASIQISKLFVNSWINSYGIAVSAFSGIANKISNTSNLISAALNTSGSTMVSQNIAAKNYNRVNKILVSLGLISISVAIGVSCIFVLFPREIIGIFTKEETVLAIGNKYIPIAILLFFGSAFRAIMNALINGSGNNNINFVTAILDGIVLRIGLAIIFGLLCNMKYYGFWLGDALAGFTPFFIGIVFYFSNKWKTYK